MPELSINNCNFQSSLNAKDMELLRKLSEIALSTINLANRILDKVHADSGPMINVASDGEPQSRDCDEDKRDKEMRDELRKTRLAAENEKAKDEQAEIKYQEKMTDFFKVLTGADISKLAEIVGDIEREVRKQQGKKIIVTDEPGPIVTHYTTKEVGYIAKWPWAEFRKTSHQLGEQPSYTTRDLIVYSSNPSRPPYNIRVYSLFFSDGTRWDSLNQKFEKCLAYDRIVRSLK